MKRLSLGNKPIIVQLSIPQRTFRIYIPKGLFNKFSHNYYDWYYNTATKKIIEQRKLKDGTKVIATWDASLTWEITEDTKEIAGYKVQKAIAQVHYLR